MLFLNFIGLYLIVTVQCIETSNRLLKYYVQRTQLLTVTKSPGTIRPLDSDAHILM